MADLINDGDWGNWTGEDDGEDDDDDGEVDGDDLCKQPQGKTRAAAARHGARREDRRGRDLPGPQGAKKA